MHDFSPFNVKDELKPFTVEQIRDWQKNVSMPYSVAMYNTVKDFNLASVIRNACAFGLETIYIIGRRNWDRRGAVGAQNYVNIEHVETFEQLHTMLGSKLIGLELPEHYPSITSFKKLHEFEFFPGDCILMGEENAGIPIDDLEQLIHKVHIPQIGAMRSLNAATAAGIAMYYMTTYSL